MLDKGSLRMEEVASSSTGSFEEILA